MKDELLIKTTIACIACDGNISKEEIAIVEKLHPDYPYLSNLYQEVISKGIVFIKEYLDLLMITNFTKDEELQVLDIAYKSILADNVITYSEVSFFKVIRSFMKISDEQILEHIPNMDCDFLSKDVFCSVEQIVSSYLKESAPIEVVYNLEDLEDIQTLL